MSRDRDASVAENPCNHMELGLRLELRAEQQEVAWRRKNGEEFPAEASISKVKIGSRPNPLRIRRYG